jgi:small subunit ribosomal protein S9
MTKKVITKTKGSRKRATARVWLTSGKGEVMVNDRPLGEYFPAASAEKKILFPFQLTNTEGKFDLTAKVAGGGKESQLTAVIHGIARALNNLDREKFRAVLKKNGLLTRDDRERERRKPGTARSARAKRQSPKR